MLLWGNNCSSGGWMWRQEIIWWTGDARQVSCSHYGRGCIRCACWAAGQHKGLAFLPWWKELFPSPNNSPNAKLDFLPDQALWLGDLFGRAVSNCSGKAIAVTKISLPQRENTAGRSLSKEVTHLSAGRTAFWWLWWFSIANNEVTFIETCY